VLDGRPLWRHGQHGTLEVLLGVDGCSTRPCQPAACPTARCEGNGAAQCLAWDEIAMLLLWMLMLLLLAFDARLPRACRQIEHGHTTPFVRPRFVSAPLLGSQG
jgi:hypothetical protein